MFRSSAFVCLFVCSFELALDFEIPDPVTGRTILRGSASNPRGLRVCNTPSSFERVFQVPPKGFFGF